MIKDFILSFKIKNTYRANTIIYSLKKLPLINRLLPNTLYSNSGLKALANIIGFLIEVGTIFVGKLFYILIMIVFAASMYKVPSDQFFLHAFVLLTISGGLLNSNIFNPSKDKYYAICLMKFDAKRYTLSNYSYFLLKIFIGFIPFTILFGLSTHVNILICLLLPFFVLAVKISISAWGLWDSIRRKKVINENLPTVKAILVIFTLLLATYGLPFLGITISNIIFYGIFGISLLISIPSLFYILKSNQYSRIYKELLTSDNVLITNNTKTVEFNRNTFLKQINSDAIVDNGKTGYEFFNDIFVQRHKKMLWKATKRISLIAVLVFVVAIAIALYSNEFSSTIHRMLLAKIPYFLFIMYILNRGEQMTKMMFINCDRSMLNYRFYRQPEAILQLFKERLKTLITLNIIPGLIMSIGTVILLFVSGGVDFVNYILAFLSIFSMSIFFSVHYLVLYYLLQPYTIDIEMKDPRFGIINGITYFICYFALQVRIPIFIFGICMVLFTIIYSIIALFLAYRHAPKTFKLRN